MGNLKSMTPALCIVVIGIVLIAAFSQPAFAGCSIRDMENDPASQHWLVEHGMADFGEEDIDYSNLSFAEACSETDEDIELSSSSKEAKPRSSINLLFEGLVGAVVFICVIAVVFKHGLSKSKSANPVFRERDIPDTSEPVRRKRSKGNALGLGEGRG